MERIIHSRENSDFFKGGVNLPRKVYISRREMWAAYAQAPGAWTSSTHVYNINRCALLLYSKLTYIGFLQIALHGTFYKVRDLRVLLWLPGERVRSDEIFWASFPGYISCRIFSYQAFFSVSIWYVLVALGLVTTSISISFIMPKELLLYPRNSLSWEPLSLSTYLLYQVTLLIKN